MQDGYFLLLFAFVLVAFLTGFLLAVFTFAATLELPPPILNIFVPHVVQIPLMACRRSSSLSACHLSCLVWIYILRNKPVLPICNDLSCLNIRIAMSVTYFVPVIYSNLS